MFKINAQPYEIHIEKLQKQKTSFKIAFCKSECCVF